MIDLHHIFKRLVSDNPNERQAAAHKLHATFVANGGHPDDWEIRKRGTKTDEATEARIKILLSKADLAEKLLEIEKERSQNAREEATRHWEAHERAEAEIVKLREQLNKARARAKAPPDPTERVDILSGLLPQQTLDALDAEQIGERMQTLFTQRDLRQHNITAQVDLVIGQLTDALYQRHTAQFGKRKRGSNAPTQSKFLEDYTGRSASWCRRCYKAFHIVTADDWDAGSWDDTGGIEGINRSAADPNKPKVKRVGKTQRKLDALRDVVGRKQWEHAEQMVSDWDSGE